VRAGGGLVREIGCTATVDGLLRNGEIFNSTLPYFYFFVIFNDSDRRYAWIAAQPIAGFRILDIGFRE